MGKSVKGKTATNKSADSLAWKLALVPTLAFVVKVAIAFRIEGFSLSGSTSGDVVSGLKILLDNKQQPRNAWLGADGENYLYGVWAIADQGIFSKDSILSYWPSGYPLLLWLVLSIFSGWFFIALSILQSLLYAVASFFFVNQIRKTKLKQICFPLALILAINPTISLNTLAIGYELPVLSLILLTVGSMIREMTTSKSLPFGSNFYIATISSAFAVFMQPRLIVICLLLFLLWAMRSFAKRVAAGFLILATIVVSSGPLIMVARNQVANGYATISTNLGVTMGIGAGDEADGSYTGKFNVEPCLEANQENPVEADRARVNCVLEWYFSNPERIPLLVWNKSRYFWSPWFGPNSNGTMARNPWTLNHPFNSILATEGGFNLIFGMFGKVVSSIWTTGSLFLMFIGLRTLWRLAELERFIGLVVISLILFNWLSSVATIGDNRFRIPTMGLSVLLQLVGFLYLTSRRRFDFSKDPISLRWTLLKARVSEEK